MVNRENDGFC